MMSSARRAANLSASFVGAGDGMLVSAAENLGGSRLSEIERSTTPFIWGVLGARQVALTGSSAGSTVAQTHERASLHTELCGGFSRMGKECRTR